MRHFVFEDYATDKEFIIGADTLKEAIEQAALFFADPVYICEFSDDEAESSGLDEY